MLCGRFFWRFFSGFLEPAMNRMLVVALMAACMVDLICLFGHL